MPPFPVSFNTRVAVGFNVLATSGEIARSGELAGLRTKIVRRVVVGTFLHPFGLRPVVASIWAIIAAIG